MRLALLAGLGFMLCITVPPGDSRAASPSPTVLIGLGDSLTQGTMDATDNYVHTMNAYLQRVANSLAQRIPLAFRQPLFTLEETRTQPFQVPTNLGVDGSDSFSMEGVEYYQRVGAPDSYVSPSLLADALLPGLQRDKYDKVLYPINVYRRQATSQVDSAIWLLNQAAPATGIRRALVVQWIGNNDSSTAALGSGGKNPTFLPVPVEQVTPVMPLLSLLLKFGERRGVLSFAPYTMESIQRNLTQVEDFSAQYHHLLDRLQTEGAWGGVQTDFLLLTLPYYSAIGYLFDSEDLEFYFRKVKPEYTVPPSFKRVAPPGQPITNPLVGDRISLLTFGLMYGLLSSGYSVDYVNQVLEVDGVQRDGLVLSEQEQQYIMDRIDAFNAAIKVAALSRGQSVHVIDVGQYLNDALTGNTPVQIGDKVLSRKWVRGSAFTLDGVHPSYTGQALIANYVLTQMNQTPGLKAPLEDLKAVLAGDPYVDRDGDGWAPGPPLEGTGITGLLYLFKDPDDSSASAQVVLPEDVWQRIAHALLGEVLGLPLMRAEAERLGMTPPAPTTR
jgi:lysophospholipase L1-like esterase